MKGYVGGLLVGVVEEVCDSFPTSRCDYIFGDFLDRSVGVERALGLLSAMVCHTQSGLHTLAESFCKRTTSKMVGKNSSSIVMDLVPVSNCRTPT